MSRTRIFSALVAAATLVSLGVAGAATADQGGVPNQNAAFGQSHKDVCPQAPSGEARCDSEVVTQSDGVTPLATVNYSSGLTPTDLHSAYKLPALPAAGSAWAWNGRTVAIVDAYDLPSAATDLAAYRTQFKLPACGADCFTKYDQIGGSTYPKADTGWGQEIALDIEMASATCPNCKIALVEANSAGWNDLATAVDTAATITGVRSISNSYGGNEFTGETSLEGHYNHPGIAITVSSGDNGYGTEYPAASQYVTAVGGTHLTKNANVSRGWTETAWSGAGSGCSKYIAKPPSQADTGCKMRMVADVSAVADPATGVAVYDSYGSKGLPWMVFGGTSVASPIIASVYASAPTLQNPYSAPAGSLFDVTSGANGHCRTSPTYFCNAVTGYDGPTGLGTPSGTTAFSA